MDVLPAVSSSWAQQTVRRFPQLHFFGGYPGLSWDVRDEPSIEGWEVPGLSGDLLPGDLASIGLRDCRCVAG